MTLGRVLNMACKNVGAREMAQWASGLPQKCEC